MNIAPDLSGPAIRDSIRKFQDLAGEGGGTGRGEFKKGIALIENNGLSAENGSGLGSPLL